MIRKLLLTIILLPLLIFPACALDYTAPTVPDSAQIYMPEDTESFGDGLWYVIRSGIRNLMPNVTKACGTCLSITGIVLLLSVLEGLSESAKKIVSLIAAVAIGTLVLKSTNSLINLGADTIGKISDYGKLLIPVLTGAMAAQGGVTTSAALYAGTMLFSSLLSSVVSGVIIPMIYIYLALCIADRVVPNQSLSGMKQFVKWLSTWSIKIILYVATGYLGITGVISGSVDSAAVKATKLAISGAVPVVGGILSDASETVLISAKIMKNSVGIYGILAFISISVAPFLQIAVQYLLTKITAAVCSVFGSKRVSGLVGDFSGAMGLVLAMTGTVCLLYLISVVCFMKGVS